MNYTKRDMDMIRNIKSFYRCRNRCRQVSAGVEVRHLFWYIMAKLCQNLLKNIVWPQFVDTKCRKLRSKIPIKIIFRHPPIPSVELFFKLLFIYTNTYRCFYTICRHLSWKKVSAMKKFRIA